MGEYDHSLIQRTLSITAIGHIQFNILLNDYMCDMSRLGLGGTIWLLSVVSLGGIVLRFLCWMQMIGLWQSIIIMNS